MLSCDNKFFCDACGCLQVGGRIYATRAFPGCVLASRLRPLAAAMPWPPPAHLVPTRLARPRARLPAGGPEAHEDPAAAPLPDIPPQALQVPQAPQQVGALGGGGGLEVHGGGGARGPWPRLRPHDTSASPPRARTLHAARVLAICCTHTHSRTPFLPHARTPTHANPRERKLPYRVVFPFELKLSNTMAGAEGADATYSLFAVVVHVGSNMHHGAPARPGSGGARGASERARFAAAGPPPCIRSRTHAYTHPRIPVHTHTRTHQTTPPALPGHYVSLIKSKNQWLFFDDDTVELIREEQVAATFGSTQVGGGGAPRPAGPQASRGQHAHMLGGQCSTAPSICPSSTRTTDLHKPRTHAAPNRSTATTWITATSSFTSA